MVALFPLPAPTLVPLFLTGLMGSVHCLAMCSGIAGALSAAPLKKIHAIKLAGSAVNVSLPSMLGAGMLYNTGRIVSYMFAGAIAAGLSDGMSLLIHASHWQWVAHIASALMLIGLGAYLAGIFPSFSLLETVGNSLWRRLRPATRELLPINSAWKLVALGAIWGWLPCGMVYSSLMLAAFSGSPQGGALSMLAFGLGTLPAMLFAGIAGSALREFLQKRLIRVLAGATVIMLGIYVLSQLAGGPQAQWEALCGLISRTGS